MKTQSDGDCLRVTGFGNLGATNAPLLRELTRATLQPEHRRVEVDLSTADFVDSEGLGALISVHKTLAARGGTVSLVGARPAVRELFRLTRLDTLFDFAPPA